MKKGNPKACKQCKGKGSLLTLKVDGRNYYHTLTICPNCKGAGIVGVPQLDKLTTEQLAILVESKSLIELIKLFQNKPYDEIDRIIIKEVINKDLSRQNDNFDPTLHIIPLHPEHKIPVILEGDNEKYSLFAITDDGRISAFPIGEESLTIDIKEIGKSSKIVNGILARIEERFPHDRDIYGNIVSQYVAVGVMYGRQEEGWMQFIYEVWGFLERFGELDYLYDMLLSISGTKIGDENYRAIEEQLASESVSHWVNELIKYLKEQLNWSEFVKKSIDKSISEIEN